MNSDVPGRVDASEYCPPAIQSATFISSQGDESSSIELSPKLRADLLDLDAWGEILTTYSRSMRVAVALTDSQGRLLGECHNPQPVWKLVNGAAPVGGAGCPFCITTHLPCTAVVAALQGGEAVMVRDQAGLTHVAVPLLLGKQRLGAIIAGQVFDRYPEPLSMRRVAKESGVSAQQLWEVARRQVPISRTILLASGDLLCTLGQAFLLQRYGTIIEAELGRTNRRYRLLVDGVRDYALFTMDLDGRVTSWNGGAESMFGYVVAEIVGQNFSCIFTPEDIASHVPEKQLHQALQGGRAEDEGWRVRRNQQHFWANVNITPLLEDAGPDRGFAIIMQDVTERRRVAMVLEETRQERVRMQETFLSHVSHELRTPLTAIHFFMTNVLDGVTGDLTPQQHEHLSLALDNVKQLKDMVRDLLDITRVETLKLTVEPEQASAAKLVAEVLSTCRTNAALKNITLRSDVAPGLPFVWADPSRVRQIIINLIDNGIKFSPERGTLTVGIRRAEDVGFLRLWVSDAGCGISPGNREIIFDRLAQVRSSVEVSRSGLGLGLFISRELVSRQGGRIWVESKLGHGSTFYFTLPVFSLAKLCARVLTPQNLDGGSVSLITVDVAAIEGSDQANIVPKIRKILGGCIHSGQDVLLPAMSDVEPVRTFFIVACTDLSGFNAIAKRIGRGFQNFDSASTLEPVICSTTLVVGAGGSREEKIIEVTARIDQLIQAHLLNEERDSNG
jgi:PAS domain S-box-containing protein